MALDPLALIRPHVASIPLYSPGKPIEEVERELGIVAAKLASNENPLGPAPRVQEVIRAYASKAHFYPETDAPVLQRALEQRLGVPSGSVLVTAGASHLLELVAQVFLAPGLEAVSPWPSFVHYRIATLMVGASFVPARGADPYKATVGEILACVTPSTRVVFVANPNNPTGAYYTRAELEALLRGLPDHTVLLWDEAYFEYVSASDYPDGLRYLPDHRGMVVARTFSKVHGLAGLRVGYGVGDPMVMAALARVRGPFKISSLAQVAALAALEEEAHVAQSVDLVRRGREYLAEAFGRMGLRCWPSQANFVTVDVGADAQEVAASLEREGYIVRPLAAFGLPTCLRITVGTPEQHAGLVAAFSRLGVGKRSP